MSGGLASWQALELMRGLGGLNMVGMDLVEVSPPYDHAEITALAGANVAYDWLCVMAERRQKRALVGRSGRAVWGFSGNHLPSCSLNPACPSKSLFKHPQKEKALRAVLSSN